MNDALNSGEESAGQKIPFSESPSEIIRKEMMEKNKNNDAVDRNRLLLFALIFISGLIFVGIIICLDIWYFNNDRNMGKDEWQGVSPAIHACYVYGSKSSTMVVAYSLGIVIGVSYMFGTFLYKKFRETSSEERGLFWSSLSKTMIHHDNLELRDVISEFREYEKTILDRRNIFWSLYTRVALAVLVVSYIAFLIGSCKIESQAGLPIISGIIAFIIGQGSELIHAAGSSALLIRPDPNSNRQPMSRQRQSNQEPPSNKTKED